MQKKHLLVLAGAATLFASGYALGQTTSGVLASLDKQPASMLSFGVLSANALLSPQGRTVSVEGDKLVVRRVLSGGGKNPRTPSECAAELDKEREWLGATKSGSGRALSNVGVHFLPVAERAADTKASRERRAAIDAATIVRLTQVGLAQGCEGALSGNDAKPF